MATGSLDLTMLFIYFRYTSTLEMNPGIGATPDVQYRSFCPGGSVFSTVNHPLTKKPVLYGCIQCAIGTYHDNETNSCQSCQDVSSRAYAAVDGSTTCMFCPYSSDLHLNREQCQPFACNAYCWLTIIIAMGFPMILMSGKCLVIFASRKNQKSDEEALEEQDDMDDWVIEQLIRQVETARNPNDDNRADESKIYDLPKDTQSMVLATLQENFFQRRDKRREAQATATTDSRATTQGGNNEWDDLEWESFEMSRILSRNYHGEVFLGDYEATQVVVKRLMTLRFDVRELFDTIRDVEAMLSFRHDNIVRYMGTIWTDAEYLCVICEYVSSGDLRALLEAEAAHAAAIAPDTTRSSGSVHSSTVATTDPSLLALAWLPTKIKLMRDVATALAFVHEQNICHGDLRSRNVLVTEGYNAKITDFRRRVNAKYTESTITVTHHRPSASQFDISHDNGPVSLPVIAPEAVLKNELAPSADIYAVGILMAELWCHKNVAFSVANVPGGGAERATGSERGSDASRRSTVSDGMTSEGRRELYRHDEARMQLFMRALRACAEDISAEGSGTGAGMSVVASIITERLIELIEGCLHRDPRKRPTAAELVETFTQLHVKAIQSSVAAKAEAVARSTNSSVYV
jgi:serine/threonine protein kinase